MGLLLFAALTAVDAGRVHENGTGAMWIAPELVGATAPVQTCSQPAAARAPELVFETLDPRQLDAELPQLLASGSREVIDFDWNPATGELTFSTTASTAMFSDLEPSSRASFRSPPSCGSR